MVKVKNIAGFNKFLFNTRMKLFVFLHYLPQLWNGGLSLKHFILFLGRLLYFVSRLQHNKFVKIGRNTRMDLYIPGYPSEAFYTACDKFKVFDGKLPCTTVLMSVTSACRFHCEHCYQRMDLGKDADIAIVAEIAKILQGEGIAFYNIEGGEPFLVFDRLLKLCDSIDARSEIWINSTGDGMTLEKLSELKKRNVTAVMFSLHSPDPETLNRFMGSDKAWISMLQGVELCHMSGIAVAFNVCLLKDDFYSGVFEKVMEKARDFNAAMVQLIHPKSAGAWISKDVSDFSDEDILHIKDLVHRYNHSPKYRDYPSISAQILEEDKAMFGCTAGGTDRFYINAKGDVQPCEFLNISFGNIQNCDFETIYRSMRNVFRHAGECWLCQKQSPEISGLLKENHLKSLPLSEELSKQMVLHWDRGKKTELYRILEDKLK